MFNNLSESLAKVLTPLRGRTLTERNIDEAVREVRTALLDADVAFTVVSEFVQDVQSQAVGQTISRQVQPGNAFIRIVHDSLVKLMGEENDRLDITGGNRPNVVLMAGLQGVGKTTTVVKLAKWLKEREQKQVSVVSADVHRAAAIEQLQTLADQANIPYLTSKSRNRADVIAKRALKESRKKFDDVLIVDTAGRLAVDDAMMQEIQLLEKILTPRECLFVVDAMTGQDAAISSAAFDKALPLTGVILSKADGDARGGAALSVRSITGKPIKFLGIGEGLEDLEAFHPDRMASRILGIGDVLSFLEEAEHKVDKSRAERMSKKMLSGRKFTLNDMREHILSLSEAGGIEKLKGMFPNLDPGVAKLKTLDEDQFEKQKVIIDSMTKHERRFPSVLDVSRKRRIAMGSGTQVQDVNMLLRKYRQLEKQMRKVGRRGSKMMKRMAAFEAQNPGALDSLK